ncbi:MAG: glycosyltransferase family 2 protein, partial [Frankiales bacterium]|nr:glycosyltransferase family 2 protein [Frankiales bacterium]
MCCRDRAGLLAEALPAVRAGLLPQDELVVVDSGSRDDAVRQVAEAAGARLVRCDLPGLSRARNAGWRAASAPLVLFTDDDCRPLPGWVDAAVAALSAPGVGLVWGHVLADADGGVALSVSTDDGPASYDGTGDLSATGHGAAMAFRRSVLEQLGGFDVALGAGGRYPAGEDKDAFWRAVRAGWQVRSAPGMAVTHVTWRPTTEALRTMYRYGVGAGAVSAKRGRLAGERGLVRGEVWRHGLLPAARSLRDGALPTAA